MWELESLMSKRKTYSMRWEMLKAFCLWRVVQCFVSLFQLKAERLALKFFLPFKSSFHDLLFDRLQPQRQSSNSQRRFNPLRIPQISFPFRLLFYFLCVSPARASSAASLEAFLYPSSSLSAPSWMEAKRKRRTKTAIKCNIAKDNNNSGGRGFRRAGIMMEKQ